MKKTSAQAKHVMAEQEEHMQLVQIGNPEPQKTISIRELFEQLAQREAEMVREGRERLNKQIQTTT